MRLCLIAAMVLLSACQLALPEKAPAEQAVNPITTGQISVTTLDVPPVSAQAAVAKTDPAVASAQSEVKPEPAPEPAPVVAPAPPPPPKSAAQISCEKGKGNWVAAGNTGTMSCQTPQRDSGKQCTRDSDCEGQCLARSRTCAPYSPLFGCNDVLQDNGQRVTLCIE